ncbi:MAG: VanZ family protein [Bacilli bacterium]
MKKNFLLIAIGIWICFIFYNSLQNADSSSQSSGWALNLVLNIFSKLNISVDPITTHLLIRKFAHIFEYFVLAILFTLYFSLLNMSDMYRLIYSISLPGIVAIIDEIIQSYVPGRAGLMSDVLIDMIGVVLGVGLVILIIRIKTKRQQKS